MSERAETPPSSMFLTSRHQSLSHVGAAYGAIEGADERKPRMDAIIRTSWLIELEEKRAQLERTTPYGCITGGGRRPGEARTTAGNTVDESDAGKEIAADTTDLSNLTPPLSCWCSPPSCLSPASITCDSEPRLRGMDSLAPNLRACQRSGVQRGSPL